MRNVYDHRVYCIYGYRQTGVGVHWITDIIGGALLSTAIVLMYDSIGNIVAKNC